MATTYTSKKYTLNNGLEIPAIGFGTWKSKPNEVSQAVEVALKKGYRHVDTAADYGNESEVGAGLASSGVPRKDIWLTTKLNCPDHDRVAAALDESLSKLGTAYVDLYLMHWPAAVTKEDGKKSLPGGDYVKTWAEMQKLVDTGKARSIGVSNFQIRHLERLLGAETTKIVPAVNQIELHPNNPSPKLVAYNTANNIHSTGYSCLGSTDSPLYKNATLKSIAEAHDKTTQQVLLVWGLQKGWSVIPKSVTPERIEKNFELDGWGLSEEEVGKIDGMEERFKVCDEDFLPEEVQIFFGDDDVEGKGFVNPRFQK